MNRKPLVSRPQTLTTQGRGRTGQTNFNLTPVYWGRAGEKPAGFHPSLIGRFCEREGIQPDLYDPLRCAERIEGSIDDYLPKGWWLILDEWTEDMTRKRPVYNQAAMRRLCAELKIPYWDRMRVIEMKAVIVRWAIHDNVPETK